MTMFKGLLAGSLVIAGIALLIAVTYLIPIFMVRSTDVTVSEPDEAITHDVSDDIPDDIELADEPDGPLILIQPFQRVVTSEGKPELEIRAETATIDQKSRSFKLTNVEEIVFFGGNGERVIVKSDWGVWNQQTNIVTVRGNVRADIDIPDQKPVHVTAEWLEYDSDRNLLTGGDNIQIDHNMYKATGNKLSIRPEANHMELKENVVSSIQPDVFGGMTYLSEAIVIESGSLQFDSRNNVIQFDIDPVVTSQNSSLMASKITVITDSDNIRILWQKNVQFKIEIPDSDDLLLVSAEQAVLDQNAGTVVLTENASLQHGNSVIQADDRITIMIDPKTEDFIGLQATGSVFFEDLDFAGRADAFSWDAKRQVAILNGNGFLGNKQDTRVFGDQIQIQIEKRFYTALNNVRLEIEKQASDSGQNISMFNGFTGKTQSDSEPLIIHCRLLEADEASGELHFIDNVDGHQGSFRFSMDRMNIQFDSRTRQMIGLTGKGNVSLQDMDRLIIGQTLDYTVSTGDITMRDSPVMWYGDTQIRADRFDYNEHDQLLKMSGNIEAIAQTDAHTELPFDMDSPDAAGDENSELEDDDQTIYLTAGNGVYNEVTGNFHFQDDVVMKRGLWTIRSESLTLVFDTESGRLSGADALGNIRIDHTLFNATGHSLTWSPETSILILRGTDTQKSQVIQDDRGSAGSEIRFFIDENRFVVDEGISMIMPAEMMESIR